MLCVEQPHQVVAVELLLLDHRVGDPLDRVLVHGDEVRTRSRTPGRGSAPRARACRGPGAPTRSGRRRSRRCRACGSSAGGRCSSKRFMSRLRVSSSVSSANLAPSSSIRCGPMPAAPTIVAARAVAYWRSPPTPLDVLAVEDVLGGHRAEHVDQVAHRLAVPLAEALLLLERLVMAERAAAHPDREPARLEVGPVDVRGRRVARPRGSRPRASRARRSGRRSRCPTRSRSSRRRDAASVNASCPSWCAFVSAIEQICSIIAGE